MAVLDIPSSPGQSPAAGNKCCGSIGYPFKSRAESSSRKQMLWQYWISLQVQGRVQQQKTNVVAVLDIPSSPGQSPAAGNKCCGSIGYPFKSRAESSSRKQMLWQYWIPLQVQGRVQQQETNVMAVLDIPSSPGQSPAAGNSAITSSRSRPLHKPRIFPTQIILVVTFCEYLTHQKIPLYGIHN